MVRIIQAGTLFYENDIISIHMKTDPHLHHYCQQIMPNTLEVVLEMYELLGCKAAYRPRNDNSWAMVAQEKLNFAIQIVEAPGTPIEDINVKNNSHIAFITDDPQGVVKKIRDWAEAKGIKFREGLWYEGALYFDLPDIFLNFVVEVMHTSIGG